MSPPSQPATPATVVDTPQQAAALPSPPLIVRRPLEALLDRHGIGSGPLDVVVIGEGESNVTLALRRHGARAVLRRPPRSLGLRGRRGVLHEARLLELLGPTAARAPRLLLACPDASVIGAPFYVMEEVPGAVITSALPAELDRPGARDAIADELVDALVELHALELESTGLREIGRAADFLERHLRRWAGIWERHRTREVPALDEVTRWLQANRPEPAAPATLVHGDYRLANVVFSAGPATRLRAVLDWELATIGDPLCDLAWMLTTWPDPGDEAGTLLTMAGTVAAGGFPTRAEMAARYAERSGRSVAGLGWYMTLALWRTAIGLEALLERALDGAVEDAFLRELAVGVPELADRARDATRAA